MLEINISFKQVQKCENLILEVFWFVGKASHLEEKLILAIVLLPVWILTKSFLSWVSISSPVETVWARLCSFPTPQRCGF